MPTISSTFKDKLRSDKPTGKNIFPDKRTTDLNSSLEKLDRHLCSWAQVSNLSILLPDTLAWASEDPATSLQTCRSLILDQLYWPSQGAAIVFTSSGARTVLNDGGVGY